MRISWPQTFAPFHRFAAIPRRLDHIMSALEDLKAAVAAQATVAQSAIVLLNGLHDQLAAALAANDSAAIEAVVADLKAQTDQLGSAVAANTIAQTPNDPAITPPAPAPVSPPDTPATPEPVDGAAPPA